MIRFVQVQNFKSLRDVQIDLERFTVFVGPNASGKSSVLQALDCLCRAYRVDHPSHIEGEIAPGLSRNATGPVELLAEVANHWYRFQSRAGIPLLGTPRSRGGKFETWRGISDNRGAAWTEWGGPGSGADTLPRSVLLRLEASKLIQTQPAVPDPSVMAPDGTGLHAALASMTLNDPDSWQSLQANLRRIIPTIRRLRHTKAAQVNQLTSVLFDTIGADSLPASQVSEGTLLVLGMLAALHAPERPGLVLLDDLDRGLHPRAQKELITLLRGLLETNPDLQIVATTHSPYMLDCMETNEVRMTFLKDDGSTACAALTSHPEFPKWKDEMTPGEMWSLFGEKWLVEQAVPA